MTAAARGWDRLNLFGKALVIIVPIFVVVTFTAILAAILVLPIVVDVAAANLPIVRFFVAVTAILLVTIPTAFIVGYLELKVLAFMQTRIGPDRTSPFGSLQAVFHGFKMLIKEDFLPTRADAIVFTWAPVVVFLASIMTFLVVPFAPGFYGQDMNIGLLYVFAVGGLTVVGLLMGGWSSFNKYSLLGGLRSAAQMVSYEIPLTLSVVGLILLAGSMSLVTLVEQQSGSFLDWYVLQQPLGALIFAVAATAEANRAPFDLTEADSEIVAGFATEYSGMRFGFFYFAEYVNVFIISALFVTFFLGGWTAPFDWPWPVSGDINLGQLGVGLLLAALAIPLIGTLLFAAPFAVSRRRMPLWQALVIGFLLFNVVAVIVISLWAFISFEWVVGLFWFMGKTYTLVFTFIWLRGTLPRVRIDQLMGFAWKWLLPVALINLFATAAALVVVGK
ncbi:MAG TPA: complex I subunit 1 family protein [Candidatus Limnocylindrales bacterium]|nr:complex I subunit 1 family protein [Candidatus Limnocylindrales bacterium]